MRKQLLENLWVAVGLQFFFAASVNWVGSLAGRMYQINGMKFSAATEFCISIRHWAFAWPVVVMIYVLLLTRAKRSDSILLNVICVMLSVSLMLLVADVTILFFPFTQVLTLSGAR